METLERAARALCECQNGHVPRGHQVEFDKHGDYYRASVLAVLRAVRDPDEVMTDAGASAPLNMAEDVGHNAARRTFTAMIDALIAQGEG